MAIVTDGYHEVNQPAVDARQHARQKQSTKLGQTMFFSFMEELRSAGISASLKEHLALLEALDAEVIEASPEAFIIWRGRRW